MRSARVEPWHEKGRTGEDGCGAILGPRPRLILPCPVCPANISASHRRIGCCHVSVV